MIIQPLLEIGYEVGTAGHFRVFTSEIIVMAIPCVFTAILGIIFLVNASTRAANPVFEVFLSFIPIFCLFLQINLPFLIIGTIIAATVNSLQLFVHVQSE